MPMLCNCSARQGNIPDTPYWCRIKRNKWKGLPKHLNTITRGFTVAAGFTFPLFFHLSFHARTVLCVFALISTLCFFAAAKSLSGKRKKKNGTKHFATLHCGSNKWNEQVTVNEKYCIQMYRKYTWRRYRIRTTAILMEIMESFVCIFFSTALFRFYFLETQRHWRSIHRVLLCKLRSSNAPFDRVVREFFFLVWLVAHFLVALPTLEHTNTQINRNRTAIIIKLDLTKRYAEATIFFPAFYSCLPFL